MQLSELQEVINKYRNGNASVTEMRLVEAWFLETERQQAGLSDVERAEIANRLLEKLHTVIPVPQKASVRLWQSQSWMRIAAMLVLVVTTAAIIYYWRSPQPSGTVAQKTIQTGPYDIRQVILPDSTVVALAQNSSLTYPLTYNGDTRDVQLSGKGFFTVHQRAGQPFIVHTNDIAIRVLGTSFIVDDEVKTKWANVSVLTGKVQVLGGEDPLAVLTAAQGIQYNKQNRQFTRTAVTDVAAATAWTQQQLVFEETNLPDVLHALEKSFHVSVQLKDTKTAGKVFTGQFATSDSLRDILDVVTISTGLQYHTLNDSTIVISK